MIVSAWRLSRRTASTFSAGVRSASTVSMPIAVPTLSATSARSPVTSTIRVRPAARSRRSVWAASGRMGSWNSRAPTSRPSTATKTVKPSSRAARRRTRRTQPGVSAAAQSARPRATDRSSTTPRTPRPYSSTTSRGSARSNPRPRAARTTADASVCGET